MMEIYLYIFHMHSKVCVNENLYPFSVLEEWWLWGFTLKNVCVYLPVYVCVCICVCAAAWGMGD